MHELKHFENQTLSDLTTIVTWLGHCSRMKHSRKGEGNVQGGSLSTIPSVEITEMTTVIKYIF